MRVALVAARMLDVMMNRLRQLHDGLFLAAMLVAQAACVVMLVGSLGYYTRLSALDADALVPYLDVALSSAPFLVFVAFAHILRKSAKRRSLSLRSCAVLLAVTLLAMHATHGWFTSQMHDIALLFGSHGRWGCETVNDDGSPAYILRAGTMPALLFGPLIASILLQALLSRMRRGPGALASIACGAPDAR